MDTGGRRQVATSAPPQEVTGPYGGTRCLRTIPATTRNLRNLGADSAKITEVLWGYFTCIDRGILRTILAGGGPSLTPEGAGAVTFKCVFPHEVRRVRLDTEAVAHGAKPAEVPLSNSLIEALFYTLDVESVEQSKFHLLLLFIFPLVLRTFTTGSTYSYGSLRTLTTLRTPTRPSTSHLGHSPQDH